MNKTDISHKKESLNYPNNIWLQKKTQKVVVIFCCVVEIMTQGIYFYIFRNIVDKREINGYDADMENEMAAKRLAELGHSTRLSIFRYLVKVGGEGAPVGQIQAKLGIPGSTLSHHINRLVSVGLIRQDRESRTLYCVPQFEVLKELIEFLMSECCTEDSCAT